jgi:hypothetical protein
LTSQPSHAELAVLAVYLCGGDGRAIDTEDVAIKVHELAPTRFSWRKYPQQINLELVRVSLSDAKKEEKGALLDGSGKTGWTLTPKGLAWARVASASILKQDLSRTREQGRGGSVDEHRWRRERERVLGSRAFQSWRQGQAIPYRDAAEVYRIDSYAVGRMRSMKITRLKSLFEQDDQVLPFLTHVAEILENSEPGNADADT